MTTPRIEEMVEEFERNHPGTMKSLMGLEVKDFLRQALTEAHQAGVQEERERIVELLNVQEDEDGNLFIELDDVLKEVLGL